MATFYSDIAAKQLANKSSDPIDPLDMGSGNGPIVANFTIPSGAAANDVIRLVQVPSGSRVLVDQSNVVSQGAGTTCTVDVGDDDDTVAADPDRYADGMDVAAAGEDKFSSTAAAARLTPYTTGKKCWITATLATANTLTTGNKLRFNLYIQNRGR